MATLSLANPSAAQTETAPAPPPPPPVPVPESTPVVIVTTPAAAPIPAATEAPSESPPPPAEPPRWHAKPREKGRFSVAPSGGWMYFQQYGVPIQTFDGQIALGAAFPKGVNGIAIDADGLVTFKRGKTEMGRDVSGVGLGGEMVMHIDWVRIGFGLRVGGLSVARSSSNGAETGPQLDLYASAGVEPFAIDGMPVFFEARLHGMLWGEGAAAYFLGAGLRWCNGGCPK